MFSLDDVDGINPKQTSKVADLLTACPEVFGTIEKVKYSQTIALSGMPACLFLAFNPISYVTNR